MSIVDWSFVFLLSGALLFFLFSLLFLLGFLRTSRKWKQVKHKKPPRKKKKRRQFVRMRQAMEKKRKRQRLWSVVFLLLAGSCLGGSLYSRYYQQHHLQAEDASALVQSYYLLEEAAIQLQQIEQDENPQKSVKNIQELSSRLASYGARKASLTLTEDGQKLLNRHFTLLRELGVNLSGQTLAQLQQPGKTTEYLGDIEKVQESQGTVFQQFNVNEGALKQQH